jgi:uncharacterized membrane protein YvbJ
MKCPSCGKDIKDHGNYCPQCGAALTNVNWDAREVARLQMEYDQAKSEARNSIIASVVAGALALIMVFLSPGTLFVSLFFAVALMVAMVISFIRAARYEEKAKKIQKKL